MLDVDLIEQVVFNPPHGMERWRHYRIEYGGHARDCLVEGGIWLPEDADPGVVVDVLMAMQEEDTTIT